MKAKASTTESGIILYIIVFIVISDAFAAREGPPCKVRRKFSNETLKGATIRTFERGLNFFHP